eukprot:1943569-Rhodomonas_salina.3
MLAHLLVVDAVLGQQIAHARFVVLGARRRSVFQRPHFPLRVVLHPPNSSAQPPQKNKTSGKRARERNRGKHRLGCVGGERPRGFQSSCAAQ